MSAQKALTMITSWDAPTPKNRISWPSSTQKVVATELIVKSVQIGNRKRKAHLQAVPKRVTNRPATSGVQVEFKLIGQPLALRCSTFASHT